MNNIKTKGLTRFVFQLDNKTGRLTIWKKIKNDILPMVPITNLKMQEWKSLIRFLKQNV